MNRLEEITMHHGEIPNVGCGCIWILSSFWRLFGAAQLLLATLISQVTAAHGTYLAAGGTADHIAVAIDSRISGDNKEGQTTFFDHYCKILPLSDSAIFFFTGVGSLIDHGVPV